MSELKEILNHADLRAQLRHQKEILEIGFMDDCVLAHNGGLFDITPEFIAGIAYRARFKNQLWLLDRNKNPIMLSDAQAFVDQATELYEQAIEKYCTECDNLRRRRNVTAIVMS